MKLTTQSLSMFIKDLPNNIELITSSLTSLGYEVEEFYPANIIEGVVMGKTISCEQHPDADTLSYCKIVEFGTTEEFDVVCGGKNIQANQIVAWAKPGSKVGELELQPKELRGIVSNGMVLSISEIAGFDKSLVEEQNSKNIAVFNEDDYSSSVEELTNSNGYVIEVSILPDRQYASNIKTLATELAVLNGWGLKEDIQDQGSENISNNIEMNLKGNAVAMSSAKVEFDKAVESPIAIKNILYHNGIKAYGDYRDLLQAATLLFGNPVYMMDSDSVTLEDNKLNDVDTLTSELVTKGDTLIAIASKYKVNPMSIKELDKVNGLRNARGTTEQHLEEMVRFIISFGKDNGIVKGYSDINTSKETLEKELLVTTEFITGFIGDSINMDESKVKLEKLGFKFDGERVFIPSYRRDVEGRQDIVEEIMRFVGIDNITPKQIEGANQDHPSFHKVIQNSLTEKLTSLGLSEARTYQLHSDKYVDAYKLFDIENVTKIREDFGVEHNTIQTSLFKGLLDVYKHNYRQEKEGDLDFFEIQNVFHTDEDPHLHLGIIIDDNYQSNIEAEQTVKLKTLLNKVLTEYEFTFTDTINVVFNEMNSAEIHLNNERVGIFGEVHPRILRDEKFIRLDKVKTKLFYLEIDLEKLIK